VEMMSYRLRPTLPPPRRPLSSHSSLTHQLGAAARQPLYNEKN